ncbi:alpha/beta hydrolase [soil metagenome]
MPSLSVPGAVVDFDVAEHSGSTGPAVVPLHGLTSSRQRDSPLGLEIGRGLSPDSPRAARVLRYDARGHGASSGGTRPGDYSWARLAEDLDALLDHVFPGEAVHGVGPSMGTGTLLHAAVADPARFRTLTLVVPPTAWATRRGQSAGYEEMANLVETAGVAAFVAAGRASTPPPAVAGAPDTVPDVPDHLLPSVLRGAATADLPPPEALTRLLQPTLILAWTEDPTHPLSTATALQDLLPHSRLDVAERPEDVATWPSAFRDHVRASIG